MKIAIYGSRRQYDFFPAIGAFLRELDALGIGIVMHRKLYSHLVGAIPAALKGVCRVTEGPDFEADVAVSIGGDGTFLRTAQWLGGKEIPVVGVNTGHLGYLAAVSVDELASLPSMLMTGSYHVEPRGLIAADCPELRQSRLWPYALNEVAVAKEESSSMISAEVTLDGHHLADYRADGLLVCTPTGSTAYNLSIGGPIVQPMVPVRVIAPIAAHSLSMRPLVVGAASEIVVKPEARASHVRLSLDGRSLAVAVGTSVALTDAPFKVLVIRKPDTSFAETLREKLRWAD